jgi:hypothetical protein
MHETPLKGDVSEAATKRLLYPRKPTFLAQTENSHFWRGWILTDVRMTVGLIKLRCLIFT